MKRNPDDAAAAEARGSEAPPKPTATLSRRDFLELSASFGAAIASGTLLACTRPSGRVPATDALPRLQASGLDYRRARAVPTICFGCTTHCGVVGWVQDGRVRLIEGNRADPNSQGTICSKANGLISATYYPERILHPLRRVGPRGSGRWERISWDEALDEVATHLRALREAGRPEEFVFQYGRDKTKGFSKRFTNAFGTPHRLNRRSICSSNRRVPLMSFYGREFEWETQDLENTRFVLNFGGNPMEAYQGGQYMRKRLMDARVDRGAKLVTFEVRPSATASVSDEYFAVRPGSDGAIAFAMAHVIVAEGLADEAFWRRWANIPFEQLPELLAPYTPEFAEAESGVPAADIRRLARAFADAAPACCTMSNRGSAKHYNGVGADRGIRMLDVLVGNVGRPGGFCLSSLRMWKERYGQWGLPTIDQPAPRPPSPKPWKPGTREFELLPEEVKERVRGFPEDWQNRYFGELATPSEYPLSWHWYSMRVGQLVYPMIEEGRQKVGVYMSYVLGAAYGFPEAGVARRVLKDESLIPFHVAIDIGYGEQTALADIILPDATALERWDAHSTNSYGLRPYTGLRQPLVEPLGEARPAQIIWRDLARRIGGGMERYFDFDDLEDYYRQWYSEVPVEWEQLKRDGIWFDPERPLDYELYEQEVPSEELAGSERDPKTGVVYATKGSKRKAIGIERNGRVVRGFDTPDRRIGIRDDIFPLAAALTGLPADDMNANPLPTYGRIPGHTDLAEDEFVFTTFKWNVHAQGRSSHWKHAAEIVHTNHAMIGRETAEKLGVATGDWVEITTFAPLRPGDDTKQKHPLSTLRNRVRVMPGMSRKVVACAHHGGHWEHGPVARAANDASPAQVGLDASLEDRDIRENLWWSEAQGGPGGGVPLNDSLPINAQPLVGGQNWFDTVCRVRKLGDEEASTQTAAALLAERRAE